MTFPKTGGCLRGAIRYASNLIYVCHCTDCQRLSGGAFSVALAISGEAFFLISGNLKPLRRVTPSGRTSTRWVCPDRGVAIRDGTKPGPDPADPVLTVRAGTLDDTSWVRPAVHFWTQSAQPWVTIPPGVQRFPAQPENWRQTFDRTAPAA